MDRLAEDGLSWVPSRRMFLRRVMINASVTFFALLAVAVAFSLWFDLPIGWGFSVALVLTAGFVLEDVMRWRQMRTDLWQVADGHLIHDGVDGRAQIPLSEVADVRLQFGNRVIIKLRSGQRMAMRDLAYPAAAAAQIDEARQSAGS